MTAFHPPRGAGGHRVGDPRPTPAGRAGPRPLPDDDDADRLPGHLGGEPNTGTTAAHGTGATHRGLPVDELVADLRLAHVSRAIDDRQIAMQKQSRVFFQISGAGHEALGLGLARHLRAGHDWFFPYYRDQALVLGLGVTPTAVLLQAVGSADDPSSAGRQMPSHWGDRDRHIVTQSSPTGSQCIPAVGCAEAGRYLLGRPHLTGPDAGPAGRGPTTAHADEITYVSLGEGACCEGEFWESINTAAHDRLPVLYVVPDNGYAISVPGDELHPAPVSDLLASWTGLAVHRVDGTDYVAVRKATAAIVERIRSGAGPALLHAEVVRPYSHSAADTQAKYRSAAELGAEAACDPIDRLERELVEAGVLTADEAAGLRAEARRLVVAAAEEALAGARPDPTTIGAQVTDLPPVPATPSSVPSPADPSPADLSSGAPGSGGERLPLGAAIGRALGELMDADERIRVFGQDVADARPEVLDEVEGKGGVFGTTLGLQRRHGVDRCFNTPLSEANIVGRAVGQGLRGLRPAPEVQFFDYVWPAMTQIRSEAATIRWRSNGAWTCPMVLRVPIGGYLTGGSIWHSQCGESIFAHVPGLSIAMPSRARDAVGLLRYAFTCEDPVLFLEHKHLLRQPYTVDAYPDPGWVLPFGVGEVRRSGDDVTVVSWGATVEKSLRAADDLAEREGVEAEVLDLRTIAPWDHALVAASVARTGRLLVVHEDTLSGGFGGEVAAWAGEHCFADLDAPVRRIGALDTPVAYEPTLERAILPQEAAVVEALWDLATY